MQSCDWRRLSLPLDACRDGMILTLNKRLWNGWSVLPEAGLLQARRMRLIVSKQLIRAVFEMEGRPGREEGEL